MLPPCLAVLPWVLIKGHEVRITSARSTDGRCPHAWTRASGAGGGLCWPAHQQAYEYEYEYCTRISKGYRTVSQLFTSTSTVRYEYRTRTDYSHRSCTVPHESGTDGCSHVVPVPLLVRYGTMLPGPPGGRARARASQATVGGYRNVPYLYHIQIMDMIISPPDPP